MELSVLEIKNRIYSVRGQQVVLDRDLAEFYHTKTKVLNQAVSRNLDRFPTDFVFQLTLPEIRALPIHAGIGQRDDHGGTRTLPYGFTREGFSMLSTVLRGRKAIQVNIMIVRAFAQLGNGDDSNRSMINRMSQLEIAVKGMNDLFELEVKGVNGQLKNMNEQFRKGMDAIHYSTKESATMLLAAPIQPAPHFVVDSVSSKLKAKNITIEKNGLSMIEVIQRAVAKYFNLRVQDLNRVSRVPTIVLPRQIAIYLIRELTGISLREIGSFFGSKDHSTVLHAFRKISDSLETDTGMRAAVDAIKKSMGGNSN